MAMIKGLRQIPLTGRYIDGACALVAEAGWNQTAADCPVQCFPPGGPDLPLNFHPFGTGVLCVDTPFGAGRRCLNLAPDLRLC